MARTWASASCGDLRLKQQPHREKKAIILHIVSISKTRVSSTVVGLVAGESQYGSGWNWTKKNFSQSLQGFL